MLKEAKRLFDLGVAVHWLKPRSKVPVKTGWSGPTRDTWNILEREYREGYGLGARMGEASRLGTHYLANIDVDLKSAEPRHRADVLAALAVILPDIPKNAPCIKTGYGYRYLVKTAAPAPSGRLAQSPDVVKVLMPSTEVNRRQLAGVKAGVITKEELGRGYRLRPAWEISFMSTGTQVVLPPSIHPETGRPYTWLRPFRAVEGVPVIDPGKPPLAKDRGGRPKGSTAVYRFDPVQVDLSLSRLSKRTLAMLVEGDGVEDRSAACFSVTIAMLKAGYTDLEIMSVLTDRANYLGETAYDHRGTDSRAAAAAWVRDYCLAKARREHDAAAVFEDEAVTADLAPDAAEAQLSDLTVVKEGDGDWRRLIVRSGPNGSGPPKPTAYNVILLLTNLVGEDVFRLDEFNWCEIYGRDAPWTNGKKGKDISNNDLIQIKIWLSKTLGVEPPTHIVCDAVTQMAEDHAFHPVREAFDALPEWDGVNRLDSWLKINFEATGQDEYLAQVFRKWMIAAVTRIYQPGAKFDWIPILQGAQGTGKSSFGAVLFGQDYFTDWLPNLADKDAALGLQGKWCVEFGELDTLRRNEVETIKAFITRQVDNVRPPYGRKAIKIRRQCVFFGTTNKREYLKDDTGNRRFNPVAVGGLDFEALRRDRDQLWAEALFIYQNGLEGTLYLEGEAATFAKEIQAEKVAPTEHCLMLEAFKESFEDFWDKEHQKKEKERFPFDKFRLEMLFGIGGAFQNWPFNSRNIYFASRFLKINSGTQYRLKGRGWWKIDLKTAENSQGVPTSPPPSPPPILKKKSNVIRLLR